MLRCVSLSSQEKETLQQIEHHFKPRIRQKKRMVHEVWCMTVLPRCLPMHQRASPLGTERTSSPGRTQLVVLWQRAGTAENVSLTFLSAPLTDGGYLCNASTFHDSGFTRHQGPPLGQTFLVPKLPTCDLHLQRWQCPGRCWRQSPVRALGKSR